MGTLIDSSLWVDYFRLKTPAAVRQRAIEFIESPDATLCEPIRFEILRAARRTERKCVEETFATLPLLATPADLWERAIDLGQKCVDAGVHPRPMDLLIAVVSIYHDALLVSFDVHFAEVARVCQLQVRLLTRGA